MSRYFEFNGPEPEPLSWWQRIRLLVRWRPRRRRQSWIETVPVPEGGLAAAITEIVSRPAWGAGGLHIQVVDDDTGWAQALHPESVCIPQGSIITEARFGADRRCHLRIQHAGKED